MWYFRHIYHCPSYRGFPLLRAFTKKAFTAALFSYLACKMPKQQRKSLITGSNLFLSFKGKTVCQLGESLWCHHIVCWRWLEKSEPHRQLARTGASRPCPNLAEYQLGASGLESATPDEFGYSTLVPPGVTVTQNVSVLVSEH